MAIVFVADQLVDGLTGRVFGHVEFLVEHGRIVDMGTVVPRPRGVDVIVLRESDAAEEPARESAQSDRVNPVHQASHRLTPVAS
jgi:hypothetical protein